MNQKIENEITIDDDFKEIGQPLTKYIKSVNEESAEFQKDLFFTADKEYKYQKDFRISGIVGNRQYEEPFEGNIPFAVELLRQIFSFGMGCRVMRVGSGRYRVWVHALYNIHKVVKTLELAGMEFTDMHVENRERFFEYGWTFQNDKTILKDDDVGKLVPIFQTIKINVRVRDFPKFKKAFAKYEADYKDGLRTSKILYPKKDYPSYVYHGVSDLIRHLPHDEVD